MATGDNTRGCSNKLAAALLLSLAVAGLSSALISTLLEYQQTQMSLSEGSCVAGPVFGICVGVVFVLLRVFQGPIELVLFTLVSAFAYWLSEFAAIFLAMAAPALAPDTPSSALSGTIPAPLDLFVAGSLGAFIVLGAACWFSSGEIGKALRASLLLSPIGGMLGAGGVSLGPLLQAKLSSLFGSALRAPPCIPGYFLKCPQHGFLFSFGLWAYKALGLASSVSDSDIDFNLVLSIYLLWQTGVAVLIGAAVCYLRMQSAPELLATDSPKNGGISAARSQ